MCTAGITAAGEWVRLYPIDYRYRPRYQQFRKYQWIEVDLAPRGAANDNRRESRQPTLDTIRILGEPLPPEHGWAARRAVIDPLPHNTVAELEALYEKDRVSLGIVRPAEIIDLEVSKASPTWKPKWQSLLQQGNLFEGAPKELHKLPYAFRYVFRCNDDLKPRKAMIEDWELGVLFLKEVERLGSGEAAAQSVGKKFFDQICDRSRDTRFFMGTRWPYNQWLVLGVFWPPRSVQGALFE